MLVSSTEKASVKLPGDPPSTVSDSLWVRPKPPAAKHRRLVSDSHPVLSQPERPRRPSPVASMLPRPAPST
eukprot:67510-Hanusia_phi.AAC.1